MKGEKGCPSSAILPPDGAPYPLSSYSSTIENFEKGQSVFALRI
jgi:hypothetical protein